MKPLLYSSLLLIIALLGLSCATNNPATSAATSPSAASPSATTVSKSNIEQALMQLERDGATAMLKNDVSFVEHTMAEDWVWTLANGMMMSRTQLLTDIKANQYKFTAASIDDMKVQVYGDAAVVIGRVTTKGTFKGQNIGGVERFTDTFVNQQGQWRLVATHNSPLATK